MRRSIGNFLARKLITLPRLSPTHTSARIVERLVPSGSYVVEYQPIMTVQCSPDMIGEYQILDSDPADRVTPGHQSMMLLECMEEGIIKWNDDIEDIERSQLTVGTLLGSISDEDEDEDEGDNDQEEWAWQAYLHDNDNGEDS
ncbi:hypothetical protein ACHAXR_006708 [Thalassiosira sp. AJA248-18]